MIRLLPPTLLTLIMAAASVTTAQSVVAPTPSPSPAYVKPPVFEPLQLGAIKPAGWLKDWCEAAAGGITGHSDELAPLFAKGWLDDTHVDVAAGIMQVGDKPKGYMLEQSAYWLDGAVCLAHLLDDQALLAKCRLRFDAILKRADEGEPPMNVNQDMWAKGEKWAHWPMAVMGRALVAEYSATHDPKYLLGLQKIYADYSKYSNDGKAFSLIGHNGRQVTNIEPMLEAFRLGGDAQLRDQAVAVLRSKAGEITTRLGWHEADIEHGTTAKQFYGVEDGHGVTFNESTKLPAIGYLYTGDPQWLRFAEASYEDMEKNEMLPYGLTSASEQPSGVEPFAMTELCNAIDYSWSNIWLLRITGNATYGDHVERTMFNAGPGGISPDFKEHVYYLSPNRIDHAHPDRAPSRAGSSAQFAPKHSPLCCTGNVSRLLPNYVMSLWMTSTDGGLAATLYGPSDAKALVAGDAVGLETRTDYPFGDEINIKVSPERPIAFPLHLRVPAWSAQPELTVNGEKQPITPSAEKGFIRLQRTWKTGDTVRLTFARTPKVVTGKCADGAPYASVYDGPLLFALPLPHVAGNLNAVQPGIASQFALLPGAEVQVIKHPMPARWSWSEVPLELKVSAVPVAADPNFVLARDPVPLDKAAVQTLTLAPFGTTAFRVSMFSVAAAAATVTSAR